VPEIKNATVRIGRIFLDLNNPRHVPFENEEQTIDYLCDKEDVYALARDIAKYGLNPLERFALLPVDKRRVRAANASYNAAEGNRRVCALKLLADPDLAPAHLRKAFEKLATTWAPIRTVPAVVFDNEDAVSLWLDRIHSGPQGGIGRKDWNSEQKQRFSGGNKNKAAQVLLDYAQDLKMITAEERRGKLTTVQRFVGNDVFREALGLDQSDPGEIGRTRPKAEFDILVKRFIRDVVAKKDVTSRMNKEQIIKYARPLGSMSGVTTARIEPEGLLVASHSKTSKGRRRTPRVPEKAKHVTYEQEINDALKSFGNDKPKSLYYSITSIELEHHTPLVCIGAWAFFDTLTACAGRPSATSFESFLSKDRLRSYGLGDDTRSERSAVGRILEYGNSTKHHAFSATFNGDQLNNDMVTLKDLILKCIEDAAKKAGA
jgi:hypothetical protein